MVLKRMAGLTLIELVIALLIVGTIAAILLPRYVGFRADAANASIAEVAARIAATTRVNHALRQSASSGNVEAVSLDARNVCNNTSMQPFVGDAVLVDHPVKQQEFLIDGEGDCSVRGVLAVSCTVVGTNGIAHLTEVRCSRRNE
ncbi:type IV pilin protein [Methylobacillus flagellatus]|uniref:type IV pilin protein n=1 Tax=Methylobacillus flagellatus TaxID=405 RepID=UPI0010F53370|nr:type II secretion system protein [Methylobacillus flagellatus]